MLHWLTLAIDTDLPERIESATIAAIDGAETIRLTHTIATTAPAPVSTDPASHRGAYGLLSILVLLGVTGLVVCRSKFVRSIKKPGVRKWADYSSNPFSLALVEADPSTSSADPSQTAQTIPLLTETTSLTQQPTESTPELTRLAKVNICEELIKELHSLDANQRHKAIWELGQRGDSRAVQPLLDLLIDTNSQQRSLILAAISEIGVRTLKPMNQALLLSLQDESPEVRKNAIRDATRLYDLMAHLSQLLHHATHDSNSEVQETAIWAMHQLDRIRITPTSELVSQLSSQTTNQAVEQLPQDNQEPQG